MCALFALSLTLAAADPSVLVMPLEAGAGVSQDLTKQITAALTAEAGKVPGYRVVAWLEVAGAMSQEQVRQAVNCNGASCAAEIAGALNTEQIVIGSLGKVGSSYLLTLSRVTASGAIVAGRVSERISAADDGLILDKLPAIVAALFGGAVGSVVRPPDPPARDSAVQPPETDKRIAATPPVPSTPVPPTLAEPAPATPPAEETTGRSLSPLLFVGIGLGGVGVLGALVSLGVIGGLGLLTALVPRDGRGRALAVGPETQQLVLARVYGSFIGLGVGGLGLALGGLLAGAGAVAAIAGLFLGSQS